LKGIKGALQPGAETGSPDSAAVEAQDEGPGYV